VTTLTNADVIASAKDHRKGQGSIADHRVSWRVDTWRRALPDEAWVTDTLDRLHEHDADQISRSQVAAFACDPLPLFVASNIWGYGSTGYGPSRVAAIIDNRNRSNLSERLTGSAAAALHGPDQAWKAITKEHRIPGFGIAFGTKFAYFASLVDESLDPRPLIADLNTSWALWYIAGIPRSVELIASYLEYIEYTHHPDFEGYSPDEVEWALFDLGRSVSKPRRRR
jgi:hypothetical protein